MKMLGPLFKKQEKSDAIKPSNRKHFPFFHSLCHGGVYRIQYTSCTSLGMRIPGAGASVASQGPCLPWDEAYVCSPPVWACIPLLPIRGPTCGVRVVRHFPNNPQQWATPRDCKTLFRMSYYLDQGWAKSFLCLHPGPFLGQGQQWSLDSDRKREAA